MSHVWQKERKEEKKKKERLDICVQRIRIPPPIALSKMAPWLRYWLCQITIGP